MTALGRTLSSTAPRTSVTPRLTTALLVLTAGVNALYLLALLSPIATEPITGIVLGLSTQWIPATVFWLVAARLRFRSLPVVLAALGVTATAVGDSYYSLAMDGDGYLASPSPADPAYLLFYPLMVAALVALVRGRLRGVGGLVLLEIAVATAGASALLAVVLDPVIRASVGGDDPLASLVALSYPLFDLVLVAVIAGLASVPTIRLGRRWWALVAGLVVTAFGDILYALFDNMGTYLAGTPLDATWAVSLALMAWWVAGMAEPESAPVAAPAPRLAVPVPALAVVAGIAMLVVGTRVPTSTLAVVLATLTVLLGAVPIVFRQAILGRMLEAQAEAVRRLTALDQAKTDILVTMNHAFRTPLTSITGHVDLLLDDADDLPRPTVAMLHTIERNAERLQELIDDTLTTTRLEEGQQLLDRVPTAVGVIVGHAVDRVRRFADERGVDVAVDPVPEALVVDADAAHLEQALVNLLDNAVKFSPPASTVTVAVELDGRDRVAVRVCDEGIGIPEADIPSLSARFFRASNVQNAAIPGVGLGFAIAEQVAVAHGGWLEVLSVVDEGTTVTLWLPLRRARRLRRVLQSFRTSPST